MSAKISAARRAAFLRALEETGNQTIAAERARVSRSWVVLHRGRDAGFDAAVRDAVAVFMEGQAVLRDASSTSSAAPQDERGGGKNMGASNRPPGKWRYLDGVELVLRGTGDGIGGNRRVQIAWARVKGGARGRRRGSWRRWRGLAMSRRPFVCLPRQALRTGFAAVGLSGASAYGHRKRWPRFARRWNETVTVAAERIEGGLFQAGINLLADETVPVDVPIAGMTADHAIQLLRLFHSQPRPGRRSGRPVEVASIDQACRALKKHWRQEERRASFETGLRLRHKPSSS